MSYEELHEAIKKTDIQKIIRTKLNELYTSVTDEIQAEVVSQGAVNSKSLAIIKDLSNNVDKTNAQLSETILKNYGMLFAAGAERNFSNAKKVLEILNDRGIS